MFDFTQLNNCITNTAIFNLIVYYFFAGILTFIIYQIMVLKKKVNYQLKYANKNKTNLEKAIQLVGKLDDDDIQKLLEECAIYIMIPNWYTKSDFEKLNHATISDELWNTILLDDYELIDNTDSMCLKWFASKHKNSAQ